MTASHGILLLCSLLLWAAEAQAAVSPTARELLASGPASVSTIYSDGALSWRSWSWGLNSLNPRDGAAPLPPAKSALCLSISPFGALSLRSPTPFPLSGSALGFYIRGDGNTSAAALGELEIQWEASAPGTYTTSRSLTLRQLLSEGGVTPDAALAQISRKQWVPVKASLDQFVHPGVEAAGAAAAGSFKADRLTIGSCLQRLDACSADQPPIAICLDKLLLLL